MDNKMKFNEVKTRSLDERSLFIKLMFRVRTWFYAKRESFSFKVKKEWFKIKCDHYWIECRDELTEKIWKSCIFCGKRKRRKDDPICQHNFIEDVCIFCGFVKIRIEGEKK